MIDAEDFYRDAHRRIFDKMVKLVERGGAIDLVTLKEELGRSGDLDEVGGPAYITALVDGVPRYMNVEHYARIIKEKATLRNLIFSATKILATAYEAEEEADVILDQAEHAIFEIADDKVRDGFVSLRDLAQSSLDTIEKLHARKELVTGVPTGFTDLDELTSGLQASDLIIVAGRPSMGKTSLVLNIAQHVGTKTGEDGRHVQPRDVEGAAVPPPAHRPKRGSTRNGCAAATWARTTGAGCPRRSGRSARRRSSSTTRRRSASSRCAPSAGAWLPSTSCDLVIIDYIQLMQGRGRFENRTLELASISRSLKGLAKELRVPIVVLSQLSRAPESRADHRPQLSDLRESGALEQDADVVVFIYREDLYADKSQPPTDNEGVAELIIGKQRNGPTGVVKLAFIREYTRFENLAAGACRRRCDPIDPPSRASISAR